MLFVKKEKWEIEVHFTLIPKNVLTSIQESQYQ